MERLGIDTIISTDRALDAAPGVRRLDPLDFATWRDEVSPLASRPALPAPRARRRVEPVHEARIRRPFP